MRFNKIKPVLLNTEFTCFACDRIFYRHEPTISGKWGAPESIVKICSPACAKTKLASCIDDGGPRFAGAKSYKGCDTWEKVFENYLRRWDGNP